MTVQKVLRFFLFIPLTLTIQIHAQSGSARISGNVLNPENEPSEYSTVVLMNQDSVFMKGGLSDFSGAYVFDGLDAGRYYIMIRNVEFNTHVSDPIDLEQGEKVALENIVLSARLNDLEEVVIKGEKAMVEVHSDKMVYNVANSVNASGNNGLELLSKSPGVMVDMDKNIIVQGKSGVRVYINGRPSRVAGSDLTNMLEGMRSDNIESIEVISNPSAKYDAEGTGGIINIILKKSLERGFNGNLIAAYSKGYEARANVGTSLNYSGPKITAFTSLNFTGDDYYVDRNENMLREDYYMEMESESLNNRLGMNFSGGFDYLISKEHTLSVDARILLNGRDNALESATLISDNSGSLPPELLLSQTFDDGRSENYNANIHYSFVPNRSSNFSADVSFGTYSNDVFTSQPNEYWDIDLTDTIRTVESQYDANTGIDLFSAMADYEKRMGKYTFSVGAKYSYIDTDNELAYFNVENASPTLDTSRSSQFSYLEQVLAAYMIVNVKATERISINAGLRVENTTSLGELVSSNPGPDDKVARNYTDLFPNVSVSYSDQENHALSISIGRRITRPNYQDLNPFEKKLSELAAWRGNPFLEANYIMNYQLTYSFKRKLVISNTYSVTSNFFANIFEVEGDKGNVIIPRNMDKVKNNGLSVSYPQKVSKWWDLSAFLLYNYKTYGGDLEGTVIDLKANIFSFRIQNGLKLPLDIVMEVSYYITSPWIWRGTVNVDGNHRANIGIKREFFDRLLLQVNVYDPFNTGSVYYYNSDYGGMVVDGNIAFDNRRIGFNATYSFGNQKAKKRKKNSAMDDELNRISE